MKIGKNMMLLDLIILQKLLRIFMLIIPMSRNLKQKNKTKQNDKKLGHLLERPPI